MIKITNIADEAIIQLFGDIGESIFSDGWTFEKFNTAISALDVSALIVEIKSNGGDAMEAFAIYDKLKSLPARVTARIVGASASAATIIASGADRIEISENSRYLVHNAQTFVAGSKENLKDAYEQLASFDEQILNIYIKRTGKSREILASLMLEERWMTPAEALEWGFVDSIIKNKPKITNKMRKFENLTEDEQIEMDALKAENEELKSQLEAMQKELDGMTADNAKKDEDEVEELVENKIKAGVIDAKTKASWVALGKADKVSMTAAINAVYVPKSGSLMNVVDTKKSAAPTNKTDALSDFKAGKLNSQEYVALVKTLEG